MPEHMAPLLSVKFRPPRLSRGVMLRPRLDSYLEVIRDRLLTVVSAPPGYGKTTAALSWIDALAGGGARVAWLSLGPEDDEPERFLDCVEAAFAPVFGKPAEPAGDRLAATFSVPMEQRLGWLLEELGDLSGNVFLFLDDYHVISHPKINVAMSFLLRHSPENLHLVILSRKNPALDLGQLRARDAIFALDASALLFDVGETRQLLHKGEFGQGVADEAPALHALTGGWIAALRAAVVTMRSHGNPQQYLHKLPATPRPISSLFSDLLEQLPAELVGNLECVCITERQCAGLAEALCNCANGQALLEQLEHQHLFVNSQDESGRWFVFHPLFREFLERRARAREGLDMKALHRRAAGWFAGATLWSEAIHHALAAGDVDQALGWIESHAMILVGDGDILTLLSWERQLGAHLVASPVRLRLAFSWALCLAMASDRALVLLDGVEGELGTMVSQSDRGSLRSECKALRAVLLAEKGDYEAARVLAEQYLSAPAAQPWVPNAILNVIASAHLHAGRWEQLYVMPPPAGEPNERRSRDRTSLVYRLCILGLAEYRQGHLEDAARYLEQGIALGTGIGTRGNVLKALPAPTLALVRYEQDRLDEADKINAEHFEINRRVGPIDGLSGCYRIAARSARMRGQTARARTLLDDAERIAAARGWNRVTATVCLERTRFSLLDRRMTEAAACITRIEMLASAAAKPSLEYLDINRDALLARAWRYIVEGAVDSAARSLEPQLRVARANGKLLDELRVGTSLALAWFGAGRDAEALRLFLALCGRAEAAGAVRSILDQPVTVDALIRFAIAQAQVARASPAVLAFMQRLVRVQAELTPRAAVAVADVEGLSPREHNILKLISHGLSNKEIARNLGIAPETVKSHVKKIFSKLGVQNRAQAAARLV